MITCKTKFTYSPKGGLPTLAPVIVDTSVVVFVYIDELGNVYTLNIRAPDLGNTEKMHINRIYRESRGKTLLVYRDPEWPNYHTYEYAFRGLYEEDKQNLTTFLSASRGGICTLIDYESRTFTGMIMNPNSAIKQTGPGGVYSSTTPMSPIVQGGQYTANIEFECTEV